MTHEERWDFFIAYASPDRGAAEALFDLLDPSFRVFLDRRNLLPGDDWSSRLTLAQSKSAVTLVLISSRTDNAYYQREEIARAIELSRDEGGTHQVVPIILDELAPAGQLPYGLRLRHAISVIEAGGLEGVADRLKSALRHRMTMPAEEMRRRYDRRTALTTAVRLVPRGSFASDGLLGAPRRKYVFVGDYDEQRHRTLREVLSNLWIGDAFEQVANSNVAWAALVFEVGELNRRKLDLLPATWKAAFRILSDPKRAARFAPTDEEMARLGRPPRDYYSDDQDWWYSRCTIDERRWGAYGELVGEVLGIDWTCFTGAGLTERPGQSTGIPSRVYFVKNLPLSSMTYRVQDLGVPDDDIVLG
ncbi:toll/interleukin-1 receptor domain-containing protein [Saccharothrix sp. BKS2]|uniref:toll/interleukin-1 receptor domain-containing protein n=1 Tax=Saccharothrix sp. BKS2 TaxID=3064400 RepID=UPI0039ED5707